MDDTLKDAAIALASLALLTGLARQRVEQAGVRAVRQAVTGGTVQARVLEPDPFRLLLGHARRVRLAGEGFALEALPFRLERGGGIWATADTLIFDFRDAALRGLPVRRFHAEIPRVQFDTWRAVGEGRLVLRGAGQGPAEAAVGEEGLRAFIAHKYPGFTDVSLRVRPGTAQVAASTLMLGLPVRVEAAGKLSVDRGRYVRFGADRLALNGQPASGGMAEALLSAINPVLDLDADLGLGSWITLTGLRLGEGEVVLMGTMRVPAKQPTQGAPTDGSR